MSHRSTQILPATHIQKSPEVPSPPHKKASEVHPQAKKYNEISIQEIIDKKLMAVDLTASIMCLENKMPMLVFGLNEPNSIVETMSGTFTGTKVTV